MVVRRTSGEFFGEHQQGADDPEELMGGVAIVSDDELGVVETTVGGRTRTVRGKRLAVAASFLQGEVARDLRAREYAAQPPRAVPKPPKTTRRGVRVPSGYRLCPGCSTGMTDPSDCPRCDGAGIVRDDDGTVLSG